MGCLSALIVNYNTAALTRACVASLRAQQVCIQDGTPIEVEVIVVDNASRPAERGALWGLEATVIYNDENCGYGAALNMAMGRARGEWLLFSNPDTWYFADSLQQMVTAFQQMARCGAVGPRLWWDREREFLLPPSDAVTLLSYMQMALAERWPRWRHYWTTQWLQRAVQYWQGDITLPQAMLSGACLLTHRAVVQACGGFDEQFRLYYEDTDWCRRLRQRGYGLYYVPTADVAHLYNQSARQESDGAQGRFAESEVRYFQKHYGAWAWNLTRTLATRLQIRGVSQAYVDVEHPLGNVATPPQFVSDTTAPSPYLFLLSPVVSGVPAIAYFSERPALELSDAVWQQLGDGRFYTRLVSLASLQVLEQWSWDK